MLEFSNTKVNIADSLRKWVQHRFPRMKDELDILLKEYPRPWKVRISPMFPNHAVDKNNNEIEPHDLVQWINGTQAVESLVACHVIRKLVTDQYLPYWEYYQKRHPLQWGDMDTAQLFRDILSVLPPERPEKDVDA